MELSLLHHPLKPNFIPSSGKGYLKKNAPPLLCCQCSSSLELSVKDLSLKSVERRGLIGCVLAAAAGLSLCEEASAVSRRALKGAKVPESEYTTLPNGLKYYDLKVGGGAEAVKGSRVAVWLWHS